MKGIAFTDGMNVDNRVKIDEAAGLLGLEPARIRFLEIHCQDFLSQSRWEIPRRYCREDLKVFALGNRLLAKGVPPHSLKSHLSRTLNGPPVWGANQGDERQQEYSRATLIAVTSGKGGVGKSNIALNLGVELVRLGFRTMLMDADLGVANVHLLAGLQTVPTLRDVIAGRCAMKDIVTRVPDGPDIVPGSSGILELADLPAMRRQALVEELQEAESRYDVILIDTAAGVAGTVLDFVVSSDFALVVTTAETTAITDAYALMKLSVGRNPYCSIGVVANRVRSAREGELTLKRIADCTQRFLGKSVLQLGCVWEDTHVRTAVNERVPFQLGYPKSRASASVRKLARQLRENEIISPGRTRVRTTVMSQVPPAIGNLVQVSADQQIG